MNPLMTVIGGPPGSGKTRDGINKVLKNQDYFNIDNKCSELNKGSYKGITPEIRKQAASECEQWIHEKIKDRKSFAVESTFRSDIAVKQAQSAKEQGFTTKLFFYSLENPELNIERVKARAYSGGHSAPTDKIEETYQASISNLSKAFSVFDVVKGFDNSSKEPRKIFTVEHNKLVELTPNAPGWAMEALEKGKLIQIAKGHEPLTIFKSILPVFEAQEKQREDDLLKRSEPTITPAGEKRLEEQAKEIKKKGLEIER